VPDRSLAARSASFSANRSARRILRPKAKATATRREFAARSSGASRRSATQRRRAAPSTRRPARTTAAHKAVDETSEENYMRRLSGLPARNVKTITAGAAALAASIAALPTSSQEAAPIDVEQLYVNNCASCHGLFGEGDGPV